MEQDLFLLGYTISLTLAHTHTYLVYYSSDFVLVCTTYGPGSFLARVHSLSHTLTWFITLLILSLSVLLMDQGLSLLGSPFLKKKDKIKMSVCFVIRIRKRLRNEGKETSQICVHKVKVKGNHTIFVYSAIPYYVISHTD